MNIWQCAYDLKIGQSIEDIKEGEYAFDRILRVPGGWIYTYVTSRVSTSTFVPYSLHDKIENI